MFVGIEEDMVGLAHQAMEQAREFRQPMDLLEAGLGAGFVAGEFVAFPTLVFGVAFAEKKEGAVLLVVGVGIKQQDGLLLGYAGEIEEVGIGNGGGGAVG